MKVLCEFSYRTGKDHLVQFHQDAVMVESDGYKSLVREFAEKIEKKQRYSHYGFSAKDFRLERYLPENGRARY